MSKKSFLMYVLVLILGQASEAFQSMAAELSPNVVLIVSDDQRPDTIAALGNKVIRTPHLDAIVRQGSSILRAVCPNPICTPSRAEILTGCSGFRNGVIDFSEPIDGSLKTLAQTLGDAEYQCWYVGKWHNNGRPATHGYNHVAGLFSGGGGKWPLTNPLDFAKRPVTGYRGWVFQTEAGTFKPEMGVGLTAKTSRQIADAAISVIHKKQDAPFFLHVNFAAPHDPLILPTDTEMHYAPEQISLPRNFLAEHPFDHGNKQGRDERLLSSPRKEDEVRRELAAYFAVITQMDHELGRIFSALEKTKQNRPTLIVFTSDHGLAVGSHGLRGKQNMYEHTIGVPLILKGPGIPENRRFDAQVYLRDLYPTICEIADVEVPESVEGLSLLPLLRGEKSFIHDAVFGYFRAFQRMVRTNRWKLIHYPQIDKVQLFDLKKDPWEMDNLADRLQFQSVKDDLQQQLVKWQKQVKDPLR